ncbi:MAG TPA: DUF3775 domain-containing protein [Gammaproteobacteria bacterium]|nr:DUF3775 domain-containing protein [Gammaproteobacteria bacterium]
MLSNPSDKEIELSINPDIVCQLITKAHEFHAQEGVVIPEDSSEAAIENDPLQVLAAHGSDLTSIEILDTINNLEPDQQVSLLAIMYLGRGDYSLEEWDAALSEARNNWSPNLAKHLLSNPNIADFLSEGLTLLGYSCEE